MNKKIYAAVAISLSLIATAFIAIPDKTLYPFRSKDKWGYCNHDKKIIIPCTYDETFPFKRDLGRIKTNNKFGFINSKGEIIIQPIYSDAGDFINDCIAVKINNESFIIDKTGNQVQGCNHSRGNDYSNGVLENTKIFKGKNNKYGLLSIKSFSANPDFDTIIQPIYDTLITNEQTQFLIAKLKGNNGIINKQNNSLIPFQYDEIKTIIDAEAIIGFTLTKKKLIGFADKNAKLTVIPKFLEIKQYYKSNLLQIKTTDNKTGYVHPDGTEFFEN